MLAYKLYVVLVIVLTHCSFVTGKKHKNVLIHKKAETRNIIQGKYGRVLPFHSTQDVSDLVKNPSALNNDEAREIYKLDNMNDVFMNPEVTSETQDLSRQGLDPYVAMQISKLDHNFQDILGPKRPDETLTRAKQKGEILPGYNKEYNADGSINLSNSEWPEYQMKDTPHMMDMRRPTMNEMMLGNDASKPQISPQAALNPNLLPGQKSDLGMRMGVGFGANKGPLSPMMARFFKSMDKTTTTPPFAKPQMKNAGFRIPGEFSFKGDRKSKQAEEEANFVKDFMSSKKSRTEKRRKNSMKGRQ